MKPSHIDFAPRSLRRVIVHTRPAIWLVGSIGLMLCVSAAVAAYGLLRQSENLQPYTYSAVQPDLFERIVALQLPPGEGPPAGQPGLVGRSN